MSSATQARYLLSQDASCTEQKRINIIRKDRINQPLLVHVRELGFSFAGCLRSDSPPRSTHIPTFKPNEVKKLLELNILSIVRAPRSAYFGIPFESRFVGSVCDQLVNA